MQGQNTKLVTFQLSKFHVQALYIIIILYIIIHNYKQIDIACKTNDTIQKLHSFSIRKNPAISINYNRAEFFLI